MKKQNHKIKKLGPITILVLVLHNLPLSCPYTLTIELAPGFIQKNKMARNSYIIETGEETKTLDHKTGPITILILVSKNLSLSCPLQLTIELAPRCIEKTEMAI